MKRLLTAAQVIFALALLVFAFAPLSAAAISPEPARADVELLLEEVEEEEESEEGLEEEEEEEGEEEEEEREEFAARATGPLPPECLLHTAEPSIVTELSQGRLRLSLHYTTSTPTRVDVDYWLKGGKGSLHLGSASRHFGSQGTLHLTRHLDEREIAKVRAARVFIVDLDVPVAPSSCDRYLTLRLGAKDPHRARVTWYERPLS
jgi:hypothetical protein